MEEFEMEDLNRPPEEEEEYEDFNEEREEETSFTTTNWDWENFWNAPDPPKFEPSSEHSKMIPQREELEREFEKFTLRNFLKEKLGISTKSNSGYYSRELYENSKITQNELSGKINGLEYKNENIIVRGGEYSENGKITKHNCGF